MNRVELYSYAKNKLEKLADEKGVKIEKYYTPQNQTGIQHYFYLFCGHLADRQFMANVVKFYHKNSDTQLILKKVLFNYDPKQTAEQYSCTEELIQTISTQYSGKIKNTAKWTEYLTGILQCAHFLSEGRIGGETITMQMLLTSPRSLDEMKLYLHKLRIVMNNLCGVREAVCYNWLKECGAFWLAKPDLHIKRVVAAYLKKDMHECDLEDEDQIIVQYRKSIRKALRFPDTPGIKKTELITAEELVALYMWEWAEEIKETKTDPDVTPYKLDRILYLYCTGGYFYADDASGGISEDDLLNNI